MNKNDHQLNEDVCGCGNVHTLTDTALKFVCDTFADTNLVSENDKKGDDKFCVIWATQLVYTQLQLIELLLSISVIQAIENSNEPEHLWFEKGKQTLSVILGVAESRAAECIDANMDYIMAKLQGSFPKALAHIDEEHKGARVQ